MQSGNKILETPHRDIPAGQAQGVGRGIFESTNKAVVADFFAADAPAAFSNVIWSSGGASAMGYFLFQNISGRTQAEVVVASGFVGIVCFMIAHVIHQRSKEIEELDSESDDEAKLEAGEMDASEQP